MAEGYGMAAAASYGQTTENLVYDTNKRSLDGDNEEQVAYKRANVSGKSPMLKTMVPNHIAGSIIGKKGQSIVMMQEQTGAKIKLSSSNEFYPGTSERVVVIIGELHQILSMLNIITDKIRIEPGRGLAGGLPPGQVHERCKQIKLIVPNSTAGMIIGKGGSFIRGITEETGAKLQISQKSGEISGERVVSITGEAEQMNAAAALVVTKCQDDPEHSMNDNLSYSGYATPHASLGNGAGALGHHGGLGNLSSLLGLGARAEASTGTANLLAQANLFAASNQQQQVAALQQASNQHQMTSSNQLSSLMGMQQLSAGHHSMSQAGITTQATYEMSVPDHFVGVILGKGGKTLSEFMQFSNANITISHKGEFISGTSNRKVVITGDPNCVQMAYFLITQKIMQEPPNRSTAGLVQ